MKEIVCILLFGLCLAAIAPGCATLSISDNATVTESRAAMCQDAQTAVALAEVMIADSQALTPDSGAANNYWTKYLVGAKLMIKTYCMN